jgi:hypothetical protein
MMGEFGIDCRIVRHVQFAKAPRTQIAGVAHRAAHEITPRINAVA